MSVTNVHSGRTNKLARGVNRSLVPVFRWTLTAVLVGTPVFAGAQEAEEEEAVEQTEIEQAEVTEQTELEDAPVVPTLIVWGGEDQMMPASGAETLAGRIPGSEVAILEGAHHACYMDQPDRFHERLLEFLEKVFR